MDEKYRRIDYLDALRGFAACSVVLYHMVMLTGINAAISPWQRYLAHLGETGVPLFFVVSAFSLFYAFAAQKNDPHPIFSFYVRRFFRIAPLFYVMIVVLVLFLWPVWPPFSGWILPNVLFYFNFLADRQYSLVPAGWTIGVEMLFYLMFPAVFWLADSLFRSFIFLAITFVACATAWYVIPAFVSRPSEFFTYFVFRHLPIFACGVVAFQVVRLLKPGVTSTTPIALSLFIALFAAHRVGWFGVCYHYALGPIFGLLIVGLAGWSPLIIVNSVTKFLGKISYSIYLIHASVINLMIPVYRSTWSAPADQNLTFIALTAMTFGIVIPLSWATYKLIEEPGINAGKKLLGRRKKKLQTLAQPNAGQVLAIGKT